MNETQALQRMEPEHAEIIAHQPLPPPSLFGTADPVEVVARASRVAASLKEVIKSQGLISRISGKEYPRCEAWTLLGTMLGVYPVLVWTRPMEGGWEARVEARTRDGSIVGAAEAQCLKSERNWGNRDDFALRSMAQTRATAKALRMPLGFVMTLGGFEPTPAEEMTHEATTQTTGAKQPALAGQQVSKQNTKKVATDQTRAWFLAEMRKRFDEQVLLQWFIDRKPPFILPNEHLEMIDLKYVPTSKHDFAEMVLECASFMGVQPRQPSDKPQPPSDKPSDAPQANVVRSRVPSGDDWREFKVPFGKHQGTPLGDLEKNTLFGFWANFEVETEYQGKPKKQETIERDEAFRNALDQAGEYYDFQQPE